VKRIGIFVGFGPTIDIRGEGIGRLLATLIEGAAKDRNIAMTVIMPQWYRGRMMRLLEDHGLDAASLEILTTGRTPIGVRILGAYTAIRSWWLGKQAPLLRKRRSRLREALKALRGGVRAAVTRAKVAALHLAASSSPLAWLAVLLLALASAAAAVAALPVLALVFVAQRLLRVVRPQVGVLRRAVAPLRGRMRNRLVPAVSAFIETQERQRMAEIANARPDIPVWYIPTLFWPEVGKLKARKVVAAPDIVYADFPHYFTHEYNRRAYVRIMDTAEKADRLICYSRYVAEHHLSRYAGADPARITVIHHGAVRLDRHLSTPGHGAELRRQVAGRIVQQYQARRLPSGYWASVRFTELPFVFYSSQYRPYKNFPNLIRAMARLVHEDGLDIRLVATASADAAQTPGLHRLIGDLHMERFVLFVPDLPSATLAAFNNLAVCAVNPTLFEGGFPFTFSEAYSVGTPSVMSRIPAVLERMPDAGLADLMLFDPQDVDDMARRIRFALENRDELFARQSPLYEAHEDWSVVAQRYLSVLLDMSDSGPHPGPHPGMLPGPRAAPARVRVAP
jgi:glycosyltransferase involved in cell wall biosynthesis